MQFIINNFTKILIYIGIYIPVYIIFRYSFLKLYKKDLNKKDENGLEAIYLIHNNQSNLKDVFLQEKSKIEKNVIFEIWEEKENKNTKKRL